MSIFATACCNCLLPGNCLFCLKYILNWIPAGRGAPFFFLLLLLLLLVAATLQVIPRALTAAAAGGGLLSFTKCLALGLLGLRLLLVVQYVALSLYPLYIPMIPYLLLRVSLDAHQYVRCCLFYIYRSLLFSPLPRSSVHSTVVLRRCPAPSDGHCSSYTAVPRLLQLMADDDDEEEETESKVGLKEEEGSEVWEGPSITSRGDRRSFLSLTRLLLLLALLLSSSRVALLRGVSTFPICFSSYIQRRQQRRLLLLYGLQGFDTFRSLCRHLLLLPMPLSLSLSSSRLCISFFILSFVSLLRRRRQKCSRYYRLMYTRETMGTRERKRRKINLKKGEVVFMLLCTMWTSSSSGHKRTSSHRQDQVEADERGDEREREHIQRL